MPFILFQLSRMRKKHKATDACSRLLVSHLIRVKFAFPIHNPIICYISIRIFDFNDFRDHIDFTNEKNYPKQ